MAAALRLWNTCPDGSIVTETDDFRFVVRPSKKDGGAVWFFVLRLNGQEPSMAAGGTKDDIHAAMAEVALIGSVLSKTLGFTRPDQRSIGLGFGTVTGF